MEASGETRRDQAEDTLPSLADVRFFADGDRDFSTFWYARIPNYTGKGETRGDVKIRELLFRRLREDLHLGATHAEKQPEPSDSASFATRFKNANDKVLVTVALTEQEGEPNKLISLHHKKSKSALDYKDEKLPALAVEILEAQLKPNETQYERYIAKVEVFADLVRMALENCGAREHKSLARSRSSLGDGQDAEMVRVPDSVIRYAKKPEPLPFTLVRWSKVFDATELQALDRFGDEAARDKPSDKDAADTGPFDILNLIWEQVAQGDLDKIKQGIKKLKDEKNHQAEKKCFLALHHQRVIKNTKAGKTMHGNVLLFACLLVQDCPKNQRTENDAQAKVDNRIAVVEKLLELGADPRSRYRMSPCGSKGAFGNFPVLSATGSNVEILRSMMESDKKADINARSFLNYHLSANLLWEAVWRANSELVDYTLAYGTNTAISNGWHVDCAPMVGRCSGQKYSALALAARQGMSEIVRQLLQSGAKVSRHELYIAATVTEVECVRMIGLKAVLKNDPKLLFPDFLLKMISPLRDEPSQMQQPSMDLSDEDALGGPDHYKEQLYNGGSKSTVHPETLKQLFAEVCSNKEARSKLRDTVQDVIKQHEKARSGRGKITQKAVLKTAGPTFIADLVRSAPEAAALILDNLYLQTPSVDQACRFQLPKQCKIDDKEHMNTEYMDSMTWGSEKMKGMAERLTGFNVDDAVEGGHDREFCQIRVLLVRGIICSEVFSAVSDLNKKLQQKLLQESDALRASGCHAWKTWGQWLHGVRVFREVLQIAALLLWWSLVSGFLPSTPEQCGIGLKGCWSTFSACWIVEALQDQVLSKTVVTPRRWLRTRQLLFLGLHVVGFALMVQSWGIWDTCSATTYHRWLFAVVLSVAWNRLLYSLRVVRGVGESLVPILDTVEQFVTFGSNVLAMMMILSWTFFNLVFISFIEWEVDSESSVSIRVFQHIFFGESELFDTQDYADSAMRYLVGIFFFILISLILMNLFIAVVGYTYDDHRSEAEWSFLQHRFEICSKSLGYRHVCLKWSKMFSSRSRDCLAKHTSISAVVPQPSEKTDDETTGTQAAARQVDQSAATKPETNQASNGQAAADHDDPLIGSLSRKAVLYTVIPGWVIAGILFVIMELEDKPNLGPLASLIATMAVIIAVELFFLMLHSTTSPSPSSDSTLDTQRLPDKFLWVATRTNLKDRTEENENPYPTRIFVEGSGEPAINGSYKIRGYRNGRPQYKSQDDECTMYWNSDKEEWRIYKKMYKSSKTLYKLPKQNSPVVDDDTWQKEFGDGDPPDVRKVFGVAIKDRASPDEPCPPRLRVEVEFAKEDDRKGEKVVNGFYKINGFRDGRPQYKGEKLDDDEQITIHWNSNEREWHLCRDTNKQEILYKLQRNIPVSDGYPWMKDKVCKGKGTLKTKKEDSVGHEDPCCTKRIRVKAIACDQKLKQDADSQRSATDQAIACDQKLKQDADSQRSATDQVGESSVIYRICGYRNGRPEYKSEDDTRILHWSYERQGWYICDIVENTQERKILYYLRSNDPVSDEQHQWKKEGGGENTVITEEERVTTEEDRSPTSPLASRRTLRPSHTSPAGLCTLEVDTSADVGPLAPISRGQESEAEEEARAEGSDAMGSQTAPSAAPQVAPTTESLLSDLRQRLSDDAIREELLKLLGKQESVTSPPDSLTDLKPHGAGVDGKDDDPTRAVEPSLQQDVSAGSGEVKSLERAPSSSGDGEVQTAHAAPPADAATPADAARPADSTAPAGAATDVGAAAAQRAARPPRKLDPLKRNGPQSMPGGEDGNKAGLERRHQDPEQTAAARQNLCTAYLGKALPVGGGGACCARERSSGRDSGAAGIATAAAPSVGERQAPRTSDDHEAPAAHADPPAGGTAAQRGSEQQQPIPQSTAGVQQALGIDDGHEAVQAHGGPEPTHMPVPKFASFPRGR